MDSKRKANGATSSESDDRTSKRRKVAEFDLTKGESPESTTAHGLNFLEQLRRTADKSGRHVAGYFEELPPREGNDEYYRRTRMPISLGDVERKLHDGEFQNLTDLESYLKRMITNAKDWFSRTSPTYDDAERLRKAISNYMTKTNPAYSDRNYQATATPLPPDENGVEATPRTRSSKHEEQGAEDEENEQEGDDDAVGDDDDDEGEDEEEPKRRSIILKRRSGVRSSRNSSSFQSDSPRPSLPAAKPDHQYENIPYKGLDFQQAQEKLVEEMIRHQEPDYDDAYFEPFMNLPPRSLKDYFKIIKDPVSLKKLQKMVKGIHGRQEATGITEFKTWSAFEEKVKLLWENAYFYNEPGSEIYVLAQELAKFFRAQFKDAQEAVSEPTQPKIKIKVGQTAEAPQASKKITIHVGGRGGSIDSPAAAPSPAPAVNGSRDSAPAGSVPTGNVPAGNVPAGSVPGFSPSPSVQPPGTDDGQVIRPPSSASGPQTPSFARPPVPVAAPQPAPQTNGVYEPKSLRPAGKGLESALISQVRVQVHPSTHTQPPTLAAVVPSRNETTSSAAVNLPPTHLRVCIIPVLPEFLNDRHYSLWVLCDRQPLKQSPLPSQRPNEKVFEVMLHPGVNVIETHVAAAIPRAAREEGKSEVEVEILTIYANVMRN